MLRLLVGVLSVLLSGCILDNKEEPPKAPLYADTRGILVIQDVAGETWNGKVDNALAAAEFRLLPGKEAAASTGLFARLDKQNDRATRSTQCTIRSIDQNVPEPTAPAVTRIDMGKISLSANHLGSVDLDFNSATKGYTKQLTPGLTGELYDFNVQGNTEIKGFRSEAHLPDPWNGIKVNGYGLDQGGFVIQKSANLEIEWNASETTYPVTDVVVQIYSASDKDVRVVECANHEMNIPYDVGIRRWTITAEQFAGVYATDSAIIKFTRETYIPAVMVAGLPPTHIFGDRILIAKALIAE